MRIIDDFITTNNSNAYNKLYKYLLSVRKEIRCGFCKYNRGENRKKDDRRNWKNYRDTQYKVIN